MKAGRCLAALVAVCGIAGGVAAQDAPAERTLILRAYETESESPTGSSSSSGQDALIETVEERGEAGLVLRYDLPPEAQSGFWYFPARVIKRPDASMALLDRSEIDRRLAAWLDERDIGREACGRWFHSGVFPYRVDCEPEAVLEEIASFDLRLGGIEAGVAYSHKLASEQGILSPGNGGQILRATLALDPARLREAEAQEERITAQIMGETPNHKEIAARVSKTRYQGIVEVEFELDRRGGVIRRTETVIVTRSPPRFARPDRPASDAETMRSVTTVTRSACTPELCGPPEG